MATSERYKRQQRATLAQIRDEFRRLSIQYPPLNHERFLSPRLDVSAAGWKEFVAAAQAFTEPFPSSETRLWEEWYVEPRGKWAGRVSSGRDDGLMEFQSLCQSLARVAPLGATEWRPMWEWIRVLHEMAEDCPTALLWSPRRLWNFPREDYLALAADGTEIEKPLYRWAPPRPGAAPYPQHPLRRALAFNVFSSSVAAIEITLAPENAIFFDDVQTDDLPIVLFDEEPHPCGREPGEDRAGRAQIPVD